MKNFIDIDNLPSMDNALIIDIRTGDEDKSGRDYYLASHLPKAYFMDVDLDLSGPETDSSGRHPLPNLEGFKAKLESFGANKETNYVIYDHGDNFSAGRLWFLLKYFGIDKAFVINGGFKSIVKKGLNLTTQIPQVQIGHIELRERPELLASFEEVKEFSINRNPNKVLIDSRAYERYLGKVEPLYSKAGHIPGASSYFFGDNYGEDGKLKDLEELKKRFDGIKEKDLIVSCGSGVTACSNLIVLDELGIEARLYNGSFSQWIKRGEEVL